MPRLRGGQSLVAVVVAHRVQRQPDLVVAQLPLKRAFGVVLADVDHFVRVHAQRQVFGPDRRARRQDDCALNRILELGAHCPAR